MVANETLHDKDKDVMRKELSEEVKVSLLEF